MHQHLTEQELLELEIEADILLLRECHRLAEELVRDRGWSEEDDDFEIQIEEEAKRQWSEEWDRAREKMMPWDEKIS